MEVFGIGPLEILLIMLVAFIVLGPERIPSTMRQLGKWTRQMREMANNITRDYNTEIREITGEINALQTEIRNIQRDLGGIATGFMSMVPPLEDPPPSRSNTAAPAEPIGSAPTASPNSIEQALIDDVQRASTPPAPPTTPGDQTNSDDAYEI